jgi:protein-S-isoprenylcysteine O-methyltransferase Ste14
MALIEEFERTGNWLFKRRGYLPVFLLLAGFIVLGFKDYSSFYVIPIKDLFYLAVSFTGFGIRIYTIGHTPKHTSGRNISRQRANVLNTTGIYSVIRHPLYLGNFIIWLGLALFLESVWLIVLFILVFWLYYERIMFAEEMFLRDKFGKEFLKWAEKTPAFFPNLKKWIPGELLFSWKNVFKREYNGFGNILAGFTLFDLARNYFSQGKPYPTLMWIIIFAFGFVSWLIIRTLEKKTKLFHLDDR